MRKYFVVMLFLILASLGVAWPVSAHGGLGTLQIANQPIGAYRLNVWTTPEMLRPGDILVAAVITADNGGPVLGCHVTYFLRNQHDGKRIALPTTAATAVTGFAYETIFHISEPGAYLVEIEIATPGGDQADAAFSVEIVSVSLATKIAIYIAVVVTFILCVWFVREAYRFWWLRLLPFPTK